MFKNKNWFKVLVPQVVAVVVFMAVFFGFRWLEMEDKDTAIVVALVATITTTTTAATTTAALVATIAATTTASALAAVVAVVVALAVIALAVAFAAEEYKLPWYWVAISYLTEAAVIFLPLYITIS